MEINFWLLSLIVSNWGNKSCQMSYDCCLHVQCEEFSFAAQIDFVNYDDKHELNLIDSMRNSIHNKTMRLLFPFKLDIWYITILKLVYIPSYVRLSSTTFPVFIRKLISLCDQNKNVFFVDIQYLSI